MKRPAFAISLTTYLLVGSCCLATQQEHSWSADSPIEKMTASLTIRPTTCVVKQQGQICKQAITVSFVSQQQHNLCIYQVPKENPLWCKEQTSEIELNVTVTANKSIKLQAVDEDKGLVLATSSFTHSVFEPVDKRKRRNYGIGIL